MKREGGLYWGWYVVMGAFLILGINYGSRYCFGVFVKPMALEYGWSRSVISLGASLMILAYGIGGILSGRLLDRMAPKWLMTLGALVVSAGFIAMGYIRAPWQFYLVYGLICGGGAAFFGVVVNSSYVGKWFVKRRGTAIGIATIGIGIGTMLLAPLSGYIVKVYGWRMGFSFLGILILGIGVLLSQGLMGKTKPEDYGLAPDGDPSGSPTASAGATANAAPVGWVLKDSRFWILAVCYSLAVMAEMSAFVHQVAYARDNHIEEVVAASSLGFIGIGSIGGRFFFGWLSDHIPDAKYSASLGFIFMAAGMIVLLNTTSATLLMVYALLFGFGYGSIATMMPYLLADRFGREVLGTAYGILTFFVAGIGGSIGPVLGGALYDRLGSYTYAWQLNLVVLILAVFLILAMKPRIENPGR
ncbi:MAG TPA: MFS transporter [Syntrophales bacterium]|nr:MFS transporter [Syntrophales bacterium]